MPRRGQPSQALAIRRRFLSIEPLECRRLLTGEIEPNGAFENATSLPYRFSGSFQGTISTSNDLDFFKIQLQQGDLLATSGVNEDPTSGYRLLPRIELYNNHRELISSSSDGSINGYRAPESGTYYISISSTTAFGTVTGLYDVDVFVEAFSGTTEVEPNGVGDPTNDLDFTHSHGAPGSVYYAVAIGEISSATDRDRFEVLTGIGVTISVQLDNLPLRAPEVRLYSQAGDLIAEDTSGLGLQYTTVTSDYYTLEFTSSGESPLPYSSSIYVTDLATIVSDHGNDFDSATIWDLTLHDGWRQAAGTLTDLNDIDVYRLEFETGHDYSFTPAYAGLFNTRPLETKLYNEFGQLLYRADTGDVYSYQNRIRSSNGIVNALNIEQLTAGTYYLTIQARNTKDLGPYSFESIQNTIVADSRRERDVPLVYLNFHDRRLYSGRLPSQTYLNDATIPLAVARLQSQFGIYDIDITLQEPDDDDDILFQSIANYPFAEEGHALYAAYGERRPYGEGMVDSTGTEWTKFGNGPADEMIGALTRMLNFARSRDVTSVFGDTLYAGGDFAGADWLPVGNHYSFNTPEVRIPREGVVNQRDRLDYRTQAGYRLDEQVSSHATLANAQDLTGAWLHMKSQFEDIEPLNDRSYPHHVRTADVNGDGNVDLVEKSSGYGMALRFGNGDGTFAHSIPYSYGDRANTADALDVGDFNHDGRDDVLILESDDGYVQVLLSQPDGSLEEAGTYPTGERPPVINAGDLNHDGHLDFLFVTGGFFESDIVVYMGAGDGTFSPAGTYPTGGLIKDSELADINGDGNLDLVLTDVNSDTFTTIGDGNGGFVNHRSVAEGARRLGLGDLNQDGILDLITIDTRPDRLSVALGLGDGLFGPETDFLLDESPTTLSVGDLDGDSVADVLVGYFYDAPMQIFYGRGDGGLHDPLTYNPPYTAPGTEIADVNDDGLPDILVLGNLVRVLLGTPADPTNDQVIVEGKITEPDEVDVYRVQGLAQQRIHFDIDSAEFQRAADLKLTLYDSASNVIATNSQAVDRESGIASVDPYLDVTLDVAGTYFVAVESEWNTVGSYRLKYTPEQALDTDPPRVISQYPDMATEVSSTNEVIIYTNDQLDPATLNPDNIYVTGQISGLRKGRAWFDPMHTALIWEAAQPLPADYYTITLRSGVEGISDLKGNLLDGETLGDLAFPHVSGDGHAGGDYVGHFVVASVARQPAEVISASYFRNPFNRGEFHLSFDDKLNVKSLQAASYRLIGAGSDGLFDTADDTRAPLDALIDLNAYRDSQGTSLNLYSRGYPPPGSYRVEGHVFDAAGFSIEFAEFATIPTSLDATNPVVIDLNIQSGSVVAANLSRLDVTFNEPLDLSTLTTANFRVRYSANHQFFDGDDILLHDADGMIDWDPLTYTASFRPSASLANGYYLIQLNGSTGGIKNLSGRLLDGDYVDVFINGATHSSLWRDTPSGNGLSGGDFVAHFQLTSPIAEVVGQQLVYTGSHFAFPESIATDKRPLFTAQTASFANVSSFADGITGVVIDIQGLPLGTALAEGADLQFRVGNDNDTANWGAAPQPESIESLAGEGVLGSDRLVIRWPAGAILGEWLEIQVHGPHFAIPSVFYFGSAPGETGGSGTWQVDAIDFASVRNNYRSFVNPATIDDPNDFNRDQRVNAMDLAIVRDHATSLTSGLHRIAPSASLLVIEPESAVSDLRPTDSSGEAPLSAVEFSLATSWNRQPAIDLKTPRGRSRIADSAIEHTRAVLVDELFASMGAYDETAASLELRSLLEPAFGDDSSKFRAMAMADLVGQLLSLSLDRLCL